MSRPKRYDNRNQISVRLPDDLHNRLITAADDRDVSVNWLATRAIADFLGRLIPVDEIQWTRPRGGGVVESPPGKSCGGCGLPSHRYGTGDPDHEYDAMACVNSLRAELERLPDPIGEES